MVWLSIILLAFAGIAKGFLDYISDKNIKIEQWRNKYDFTRRKNHWWYFSLYKPAYSERFPFSSTILVFLTDKWHLAQFFMLRFIYASIAVLISDNIYNILFMVFVLLPIVLSLPFEITHYTLKMKR